jgi:hypothetical protein
MDMPDNSNPKMKQALFFHRNKNQAPTKYTQKPADRTRWLTNIQLTYGEETKKLFFHEHFLAREERGDDDGMRETQTRSSYRGRRCTIWLQEYVIGQRARVSRGRVFWAVDLPRARKETKYMVS